MVTDRHVLTVLRTEKKPLKARRIASLLRVETGSEITRTEINRLLYALQSRGLVSKDQDHFWTLSGEAKYGVDDADLTDRA
jgi:repressor of nif and glnA expression